MAVDLLAPVAGDENDPREEPAFPRPVGELGGGLELGDFRADPVESGLDGFGAVRAGGAEALALGLVKQPPVGGEAVFGFAVGHRLRPGQDLGDGGLGAGVPRVRHPLVAELLEALLALDS
jgi:hypothetical protein